MDLTPQKSQFLFIETKLLIHKKKKRLPQPKAIISDAINPGKPIKVDYRRSSRTNCVLIFYVVRTGAGYKAVIARQTACTSYSDLGWDYGNPIHM